MKFLLSLLLLILPSVGFCDSELTIGGKTAAAHLIQEEGVSLRPRPYLNFTGPGVTCSDSGGKTVCSISGSGSGSFDQASADSLYIRLDGTSSPSARIPFYSGISNYNGLQLHSIVEADTAAHLIWYGCEVDPGGGLCQDTELFRTYSYTDFSNDRPVLVFDKVASNVSGSGIYLFDGDVAPIINNQHNLGNTSLRWLNYYGVNANISSGLTFGSTTGILKRTSGTVGNATSGTDYVAPGAITSSGLTQATARLLGRTTASTGAIEEISVSSPLTFTAAALGIQNAASDGSTKGAAAFNSTNFSCSSGVCNTIQNINTGATPTFSTLSLSATSNQLILQSAGVSGTLSWTPTTSNKTITIPNRTGTMATLEGTQTFTGFATFTSGSGLRVSNTSPSLILNDTGGLTVVTLSASGGDFFMEEGSAGGILYAQSTISTVEVGNDTGYAHIITSASTDSKVNIGGADEIIVTASQITLGSAAGDFVNFLAGSGASAPATNTIGVVVDYYGTSATRVLTTPNAWLQIKSNGTTYKLPLYS